MVVGLLMELLNLNELKKDNDYYVVPNHIGQLIIFKK